MRHRIIRRSKAVDDLHELLLGDIERVYHEQQAELRELFFGDTPAETPEQAQERNAEECHAAIEATLQEREKERARRCRLAVGWIAQGRGLR